VTEPVETDDLADEIAEAISDTLDMDWQPSWAAPNIIAIINRVRREAADEIEVLRAELARVRACLERIERFGTGFYCPLWGSEECDWECPNGGMG